MHILYSSDSAQQSLRLEMRGQLLMVVLMVLLVGTVTTTLKTMEIWEQVRNACDYNY